MNNDQIKAALLKLKSDVEDFTVTMSGKSSKKVNGLYKPDSMEIIIHSENFSNDNEMMYTCIHEFAHHVHFCSNNRPSSSRAHTTEFRNIFHKLLLEAEKQGVYVNFFKSNNDFQRLTKELKEDFLGRNGELMKSFGLKLREAMRLCHEHQVRFEDYVERELLVNPSQVRSIMMVSDAGDNIPVELGYDNIKTIAKLKPEEQEKAVEALNNGASIDMVKAEFSSKKCEDEELDPCEKMKLEKEKLEKRIEKLLDKVKDLEEQIEAAENGESAGSEQNSDADRTKEPVGVL